MDERTKKLIAECNRQEESCLYTSSALFEWLKSLRKWRAVFVVTPILLGAVATWPLLKEVHGFEWFTATCALLAGLSTAVYKALDLDVNLDSVAKHAHQFKILQDRFRQAAQVTALGAFDAFKKDFDELMARMDAARASSLTVPEKFFKAAQRKIDDGHYEFAVDAKSSAKPGTT
jgi:hypothetical protein